MIEELANGLERNLMTALIVSGVLALLIVAAVGMIWLKGRRLVRDHRRNIHGPDGATMFSGRAEPPPPGEAGGSGPRTEGAAGEMGSRLVREAAARAAALREAWDRSYREARAPERPGPDQPPGHDLQALLTELVREQRETNALLREVLQSLRQPGD